VNHFRSFSAFCSKVHVWRSGRRWCGHHEDRNGDGLDARLRARRDVRAGSHSTIRVWQVDGLAAADDLRAVGGPNGLVEAHSADARIEVEDPGLIVILALIHPPNMIKLAKNLRRPMFSVPRLCCAGHGGLLRLLPPVLLP
jgi:hypothetical protein